MCRSVPQTPVLSTRIRTSSRPTAGTGTSSSLRPGSAFAFTSAFIAALTQPNRPPCPARPEPYRLAPAVRPDAGTGLVPAEAERLAGRVGVDPPVHPAGGQRGGAELQHRRLGGFDVVDRDVEMELLRVRGVGRLRRVVLADLL